MGETSIDRERARRLMHRDGLDALLMFQPEHVSMHRRESGAGFAL